VDPNIQMIEQGHEKRRCRREPQSRNPKKAKPENVHPVPCEPKDPLPDKRERPIRLVEMVDAEGTLEAEITLDRVEEVCGRNCRDHGYDPEDLQIHMERVSIGQGQYENGNHPRDAEDCKPCGIHVKSATPKHSRK